MKKGLVLEGGGLRGIYTSGIIDEMMAQGITDIDGIVGVSAGACFGVNMKSNQPGRALRYNLQMVGNPEYMSIRSMIKTGSYINPEFCYHVVPTQIDVFDGEAFAANPMEFHLVCTDCATGEPVYHQIDHVDYEVLEWIRASASLPMVCQPVPLDGRMLLDGGLSDSIPLKFFQDLGYERNIVILTRPLDYRKTPLSHSWFVKLILRKYPAIYDCMKRRHEMYNAEMEYVISEAKKGNTLLIAPEEPLQIGRVEMKPDKLNLMYRLGREACLKHLDEIKEFLH